MNTNALHKEKAASGVGAPNTAEIKTIIGIISYQKGKVKMTREEMHLLLDASINTTESQSRYDIELRFYPNYDGRIAARYEVHDTNMDKDICYALRKTNMVACGIVADGCLTAHEAIRKLSYYKGGKA
jgi:hypothetical protein